MKLSIALLFALVASASAYEETVIQAYIEAGYPKIKLGREGSDQKTDNVNYKGPILDGEWKDFSFDFTPFDDGVVGIRFGPDGAGDIPFFYENIRINGVPLDPGVWGFYAPSKEGARKGSMVPGKDEPPGLKVYFERGAYTFIKVKKGERIEISMRGRSGSVLDAFIDRLAVVIANLDESMKAGSVLEGSALNTGRQLAESLNALIALSHGKLNLSVPPMALDGLTLGTLKTKTLELTKAYEAEKARTAGGQFPILFEKPEDRTEIKKAVIQAVGISTRLQTSCLLEFMLRH